MSLILSGKNVLIEMRHPLLSNLSFNFKSGELISLVGKNGIGKSTILKTLARLIELKEGEIIINNFNYKVIDRNDFAKLVAIVSTEKIDVDFLEVEDLILLGRTPYTSLLGEYSSLDVEIVKEIAKDLNISHLLKKYYNELSDGQKQKVLIARALAQKPKLLLLDEPTTFLDIPSKIELIDYLKDIVKREAITIIFSTHDLELIKNKVDKIWLVGDQNYSRIDSPEVVFSSGDVDKILIKSVSR